MANTYIFNPDNDLALANGDSNYLPPQSARRMAIDLALLPAWYADEGDAVLIPNSEALYYWSKTSVNGALPIDIDCITEKEDVPHQPLVPWGWNPALVKQMRGRGLADEYLPTMEKMRVLRDLSSRRMAVEVLKILVQNLSDKHPLVGESAFCVTEEEIARQVTSYPTSMLKAPWSSSGKGLRRGQGEYAPPLSGWCARTLAQQGAVVVEPLYRKVMDFAMEFYSTGDGAPLTFVGYSRFVTDANGSYEGNLLMADEEIECELGAYVPRETLHDVRAMLQELIAERITTHYRGYVGVDMMVCPVEGENQQWGMCLHPCVEINLRMNMGVVAHIFYERHVAHGARGRFMVEYFPTPDALKEAHRKRMEEYPILLSSDGRICQGYKPLTPVGRETQYIAWALVNEGG